MGQPVKRRALTAVPETAEKARLLVKEACEKWRLQALADDASVVISELVTNAIRASQKIQELGPPLPLHFGAEIDPRGPFFVVWSWDRAPGLPVMKEPDYIDETGRGLHLIIGLCGEGNFGVDRSTGVGKTVWARFGLRQKVPEW